MIDDQQTQFPTNNIGTLVRELSTGIDLRLQQLRAGTRYETVRNSDVKVFIRALRSGATVSSIARDLDITRQAVHASVQRLKTVKVVELQPLPNNSRDKLVVVTQQGLHAQQTAVEQIKLIEERMAKIIGKRQLETLRGQLQMLGDAFKPQA
jgi:DNA-binding MarR family transcriptional regulator